MTQFVKFQDVEAFVPDGVDPDDQGAALTKRPLVQGEEGFFNQVVVCPPGWVIPPHSHDHPELFVVLEGSCVVDGHELGPYDSAAFSAGYRYGVDAGSGGLKFMVVRTALVETVLE